VVDDGSTDRTLEIVASMSDARLRVHRNVSRRGLPGNWNECLAMARAPLVNLLFQDDVLVPDALQRLVRALRETPSAALAFGRREIRYEGSGLEGFPLRDEPYTRALHGFQAALHASTVTGQELVESALRDGRDLVINVIGEPSFSLLRREAALGAGGFDPGFRQLADWEFWLRLCRGTAAVFVDHTLGVFRVHAGGVSASSHRSLRVRWEFVKLLRRVERNYGARLAPEGRRLLSRQQWRFRRYLVGETLRAITTRG
jgi:glycosyltransferase involved in cell wall biosynthesis